MRRLLITCAVTSVLLGTGAAAAIPALAQASTDPLLCTTLSYTLVNGVCVLFDAQVGQQYEAPLDTTDSDGGTFTVTGTIPPGMEVPVEYGAPGTILGGTPTQGGTYTFTLSGYDWNLVPIPPQTYQVTVLGPPGLAVVLPASGPNLVPGTVGKAYAQGFFARGGIMPYTWSVVTGTLPPGLSLVSTDAPTDNNNELAGTPATTGTFTFTMQVTDETGTAVTQQFSLTINQQVRHHR